jgi:hypothetical protein
VVSMSSARLLMHAMNADPSYFVPRQDI